MVIINEEDVKNFCQSKPCYGEIAVLNAHELKLVASFLKLEHSSLTKEELVILIALHLCDGEQTNKQMDGAGRLGAMGVDIAPEVSEGRDYEVRDSPPSGVSLSDLQLRIELAKIQLEQTKIQAHAQVEQAKIDAEVQMRQMEVRSQASRFDVGRMTKLVPPFCEEVDKYFRSFERIASRMEWPKEYWPILLQSVLQGKAQSAFLALSEVQSLDYEVVKREILKAYELVPEVYRCKFRKTRKTPNQTYIEYAREKKDLFEQWLRSKNVTDFEHLTELILLEEFRESIFEDVSAYILEKDVNKLEDAAVLADSFALSHKFSSKRPSIFKSVNVKGEKAPQTTMHKPYVDGSPKSPVSRGVETPRVCFYCKKPGHQIRECWKKARDSDQKTKYSDPKTRDSNQRKTVCLIEKEVPPVSGQITVNHKGEGDLKTVGLMSILMNPELGNNHVCNLVSKHAEVSHNCVECDPQISDCVDPNMGTYNAFLSQGSVFSCGEQRQVTILRDSGALQSLMVKGLVPCEETGKKVLVKTLCGLECVPLVSIDLQSQLFKGQAIVGIVEELPVPGVDFLMGNDIAGGKVNILPVLSETPVDSGETQELEKQMPELFPVCAVTRARAASGVVTEESKSPDENLALDRLFCVTDQMTTSDGEDLREAQRNDPELRNLFEVAEENDPTESYYINEGVLMRRWKPPSCTSDVEWSTVSQVVIPQKYRQSILKLAHDSSFAGHLGVRKTLDRIWRNFYWPGIRRDVSKYCKTCPTCQLVGKPNQPVKVAPLIPIPVFEEPFCRVMMDIVGPLPKTSGGHAYILTLLDMASRYPEAIPLRNIHAKTVVREMIAFFTRFGLPKEVQSDRGSNFMSKVFKDSLKELGISQVTSTAYHPQSQGAIERYHQTLKSMLRKYCYENTKDWDKGLPYLLFATRECPVESLGFSPFELMFTHEVRGPLKVVKERWLGKEEGHGLLATVSDLKERLRECWKMAQENLNVSREKMKTWYDKKARKREFREGDEVLVLLPMQGQPLQAKFSGPYKVLRRINEVNYVIATPDRRKSQRLCHINMLKPYFQREEPSVPVCAASLCPLEGEEGCYPSVEEDCCPSAEAVETWEDNDKAWVEVSRKLSHLPEVQREEFLFLLSQYQDVFRNTPGRTTAACHDVDVGEEKPVKQPPYRVSPRLFAIIQKELTYMLDHGLIRPAQSEWCSPVTIVPKPGGSFRFCIDYRKVNSLTKTDSYPLPRIEDCIDRVGNSEFISKFDLLKGYWQVPLTERAQEISCFVTMGQTFCCTVMPYGLKNAPATFQRMMNNLTANLPGCITYIDDVVLFSDTWEEHVKQVDALLRKLSDANLVVNLSKCTFVKARVQYLGYIIGQGVVAPPQAKIESICSIPIPQSRKELRRFIGMIGYYRRFIVNFASVLAPLTDLLKKGVGFVWSDECDTAFNQLKTVLCHAPVLQAPNFNRPFKLLCDASKVGAGAVLMQEDECGYNHPVCYFSRKFTPAQMNYSTIEQELLSLILALQHFHVYVGPSGSTVQVFTDHHPLKYLSKFRDKNSRLTRWSLYLQEYNLKVNHIRGKSNVIADCLSRI